MGAIIDQMRRDDGVGALARARAAYREGRISGFDLAEVFLAMGSGDAREAVDGVRRLCGASMRRSCAAGDSFL